MPGFPTAAVEADLSHAAAAFALPADTLYLDCAAQGPRLHSVTAVAHAMLDAEASPWTRSYDAQELRVEALRTRMAHTLFDGDVDGLAMVPSVAHGIATAACNLALRAGDAVLVLDAQFPSNVLPWQQRCAETDARIVVARRAADQDWTTAVLAMIDAQPRLRIVAIEHAHWHDGAWLDLDRVAQHTRAVGAALVLDLSQSLGVLPLDLTRWQPDFIAAVGYKWLLGPAGLAWLWTAPRWREEGIALEQHWSARAPDEVWHAAGATAPGYRRGARRFDAGGVADPLRVAMADTAVAQLQAWQPSRIASRLRALTHALDAALDARGLGDWKTLHHAPHLTALRPPPALFSAVADAFARERIVCTARQGVFRIAPHLHVDEAAMQRLTDVVADVVAGRRTHRGSACA